MKNDFRLIDNGWDKVITECVASGCTELHVICPFIKLRTAQRLLAGKCPESIRVITRFHPGEMCIGVNDTEALRLLLNNGAKIRGVKGLHAKVYLFGDLQAVVTSANLTEAALLRNHEFGFVANEDHIIKRCQEYFNTLWKKAGPDLDFARLEAWEKRISAARLAGSPPSTTPGFADEGADAGVAESEIVATQVLTDATQFFVKFFGEGHNRAALNKPVLDEVRRSGSHWACTYPRMKRPRRINDGAVMFMGRMVQNPHDTVIYGRGIGMRHVDGRDEATQAEISYPGREWKKDWPIYVRVHNAEFVAGTLKNGVRLSDLMDTLKSDAFLSTQQNARNGSGNTNPRTALRQQAHVQLTEVAFTWLEQHLRQAFTTHGKLSPAELNQLDWPGQEPANLQGYEEWSQQFEGRKPNTTREYVTFLKRCAEHYKEIINEQTVADESAADRMLQRVMETVAQRGRWADGTFNERDITQNLTPALRAYGRFVQAGA